MVHCLCLFLHSESWSQDNIWPVAGYGREKKATASSFYINGGSGCLYNSSLAISIYAKF